MLHCRNALFIFVRNYSKSAGSFGYPGQPKSKYDAIVIGGGIGSNEI